MISTSSKNNSVKYGQLKRRGINLLEDVKIENMESKVTQVNEVTDYFANSRAITIR